MAGEDHQTKPIRLFYSYSHKDEDLRRKLQEHLTVLRRQGIIAEWHDRVIDAGDDWAQAIDRNLAEADIILLLVSASFIASDNCWGEEMAKALARHEQGEARIVPVILRPCHWMRTRLGKLQAVPTDGKPITSWPDQDAAFYDAVAKIERVVEEFRRQRETVAANRRAEEEERRLREERATAAAGQKAREEEAKRSVNNQGTATDRSDGEGLGARWKVGVGALALVALVGSALWYTAKREEEAAARIAAGKAATDKAAVEQAAGPYIDPTKPSDKAKAPPSSRDQFQDCATCPEMRVLAGGTFQMGSPPGERDRNADEGPQHKVTLKPFAIGTYEVTFAEWDACVADGGCNGYRPKDAGWGRGRRPVINVSWADAQAYVAWLARKTGQPYRLPSEAEWEYAARAGTTTRYAVGDEITARDANFDGNVGKTTEVGSYPANPWGLSDMHGNVWEWMEDIWHDSYKGAPADGSAWTNGAGKKSYRVHVIRGGSWVNYPSGLRSAIRLRNLPVNRDDILGFRVARTLD